MAGKSSAALAAITSRKQAQKKSRADIGRFALSVSKNRETKTWKGLRVTLDKRFYQDPALHVRYEAEINPCLRCKHVGYVFDHLPFCQRGLVMKFGCKKFSKEKVGSSK